MECKFCFSVILVVSILIIHSALTQTEEVEVSASCKKAVNCTDCMTKNKLCSWCITVPVNTTDGWSEDSERCDLADNLRNLGCPDADITQITTSSDQNATAPRDAIEGDGGEIISLAIQVSPQTLKINLRPGERSDHNITFRLAKDYPVDLYYLMDLSQSMEDDKDKVANLGKTLANKMREITKDVRLGFGSYVDKVLMPYVNTIPKSLRRPCDGCQAPYSFKHRLNLTTDISQFGDRVNGTGISGNLDGPEGGFDAMMQAIVCQVKIGWREDSRKILIVSTDAPFHSAGDGKLGGVIEPNDGLCHLTQDEYTHASKQDYPSISQLSSKIEENRINVIFAVTANQVERYKQLSEIISGSVTGQLDEDSANIVTLVQDNYRKISSSVTMKIKRSNKQSDLDVKIKPLCVRNGEYGDTATCDNLAPMFSKNFSIQFKGECKNGQESYTEILEVYPLGLSESVIITVHVDCSCQCGQPMKNAAVCSGKGTFDCGICSCDSDKRYGDKCECDIAALGTDNKDLDEPCRPPVNATFSKEVCAGRGDCICGKCATCKCLPGLEEIDGENCRRFSGKFCQCNPTNCPKTLAGICSSNGKCECDQLTGVNSCDCDPGYIGEYCQCPDSDEMCYDPDGTDPTKPCNGQGQCVCGKCKCLTSESGERYSGIYCQSCANCPRKCKKLEPCVLCKVKEWFNWPVNLDDYVTPIDCDTDCPRSPYDVFKNVTSLPEGNGVEECPGIESLEDCKIQWAYRDQVIDLKQTRNVIYIKNQQDCIEQVNLLVIIISVIVGVVVIGIIALLIWKLLTTIHDRNEYKRFEKDSKAAKWESGENPLYVQATSTFKNPMYQKS